MTIDNQRRVTMRKRGLLLAAAIAVLLVALPAAAGARDRNHDNIPDRWEKRHDLSLQVNQAHRDQDRDNLGNRKEFQTGLDPNDEDSDGDGVEDGDEGAGTVASYNADTGELTIDVFGDGSVTGLVTEDTEISCDDGDDQGDEDGDGEGGDDQGDDDQGDDDGDDDGDEVGDDDVGDDKAATSDDEPGDDEDETDDEDEVECSTADLVPGAVVQEAELELSGDGAVWDEIELLK